MNVTRIDQIAIAVEDLDAALELYERRFGLISYSRHVVESDGVEEAMIDVGGVAIQLLQPTRDDSPIARFLARHGPGLHHLGFGVDSIERALDHLHASGATLIDEQPRPGGQGEQIAFVHPRSAGGVLIELVDDGHAPGDSRDERTVRPEGTT